MYNDYTAYYRQVNSLINNVLKAINGEYSAILCYEKLAQLAPTEVEKNRILEIRKDEKRHLRKFLQIYVLLTGKEAEPVDTGECSSVYKKGLELSFIDEQETVDFYLDIADQANDPFIKETFKRAASDEQNHAVWFLNFLSK